MTENEYEEVKASIRQVQAYDPGSLSRPDLGSALSFSKAAPIAEKIISLFKQIPLSAINSLPIQAARQLQGQATAGYNIFEEIRNFDPFQHDNQISARDSLIDRLLSAHSEIFYGIYSLVSFLVTQAYDTPALEAKFQNIVQGITKQAGEVSSELGNIKVEADRILAQVRDVAADQGVSQMAEYFKNEAISHDKEASKWLRYTVITAVVLCLYAVLTLFFPTFEILKTEEVQDAIQIGISKTLIFAVIAYMLYLCVRNLLAHRHNAVVNKHRQNALLTFRSMVDATSNESQRDAVILSAASCIYAPQDTGYTRASSVQAPGPQLIEVFPRVMGGSQSS